MYGGRADSNVSYHWQHIAEEAHKNTILITTGCLAACRQLEVIDIQTIAGQE